MTRAHLIPLLIGLGVCTASDAGAHWCSNIFAGPGRFVIRPERTTVRLGPSGAQLKVHLQNNFPYKLFGVEMRGEASGFTISPSPKAQDVHPGENVQYTFTIKGAPGDVSVDALNLQVKFRVDDFRGVQDRLVDQHPAQAALVQGAKYKSAEGKQSPSLNLATLADHYPTATLPAGTPFFGRTGLEQLIHLFGYRFCYSSEGDYSCGRQACPGSCSGAKPWSGTDQFPQDCMRAGVEVAIRKSKLGSRMSAARDAAVNAMKGGSPEHQCLAAVVGGHLWNGGPATAALEQALSDLPAGCRAAALRALGRGSAVSCRTGTYYERAACAAGEGLGGNDGVVRHVLMQNAGDGRSSDPQWKESLYYATMLYLVTGVRYSQGKEPSYYGGPPLSFSPTN
jgi:hypothetical protein